MAASAAGGAGPGERARGRWRTATRSASRRGGFTLIEAMIAVTIGAFVVLMVSGVFLVQGDFYDFLVRSSRVQDNARSVVGSLQSLLSSIPQGGIVVAGEDRLVVRRPQSFATVCGLHLGSSVHAHMGEGVGAVVPADAEGVASLVPGVGWQFHPTSVSSLSGITGATPAGSCAENGADTAGITDRFMRLNNLGAITGTTPAIGDVYMIFEEYELSFGTSSLDPNQGALRVGISGGTLIEYSNGIAPDARFEYRVGGSWSSSVGAGSLDDIEVVRVRANTEIAGSSAAGSPASFDLVVEIPVGGDS